MKVDSIWHDRLDKIKVTQMTGKNIDWCTKIKDNIFFFFNNIEIAKYWIDLSQPKLICQIHDSDHGIMITSYKANQNKLWNSILNQLNIEEWNWKKIKNLTWVNLLNSWFELGNQDNLLESKQKNNPSQLRLTFQACYQGYKTLITQ